MSGQEGERATNLDPRSQSHNSDSINTLINTTNNIQITNNNIRPPAWGDTFSTTSTTHFKYNFLNIGGLAPKRNTTKDGILQRYLQEFNFDCIGLAETNVAWHNVAPANQLRERTHSWFAAQHIQHAWLKIPDLTAPSQVGGTATWTINDAVARRVQSGADSLGRWSWTRFRGKDGKTVQVITAYCPVTNKVGPLSVWNQQKTVLIDQGDPRDPCTAFLADLAQYVGEAHAAGDQLILGADFNTDTNAPAFKQWADNNQLCNILQQRFGPVPSTKLRSQYAIDAILISRSLAPYARAGLFSSVDSCGNDGHIPLWVSLPHSILFGAEITNIRPRITRRLQCQQPKVQSKYLQLLATQLTQQKVPELVAALREVEQDMVVDEIAACYEEIDARRVQCILFADRNCRKLCMGQVPWTPDFQQAARRYQFWAVFLKQHKKRRLNMRYLVRKVEQAQLTLPNLHAIPIETVIAAHQEAKEEYLAIKTRSQTENMRHQWLSRLAEQQAEAMDRDQAKVYSELQHREKQRQSAHQVCQILKKHNSSSIASVLLPVVAGWQEITDKDGIEQACLKSNHAKYTQANNTPYPQLTSMYFNSTATNDTAQAVLQQQIPPIEHEALEQLLHSLANPLPPMIVLPSLEEYCSSWRVASEFTATGMSGIHFGHFKVQTAHPAIAEIDRYLTFLPTPAMQKSLQCWAGLLDATGGALEPTKSYWYAITWQLRAGRWRIATAPGELVLSTAGAQVELTKLDVTAARRALGVRQAPSGQCNKEYGYLLQSSREWAQLMSSSRKSRAIAWLALRSTILPKLQYPLVCTNFTAKQCKKFLSPALGEALPAAGIARNFPCAIIHGPAELQGLQLPDLYNAQGIRHIVAFVTQMNQSSITGQLLNTTYENLVVEVGLPGTLFEHKWTTYKQCITKCWLSDLWQYVSDNDIVLVAPTVPLLAIKRQNDTFLMIRFQQLQYSPAELGRLNRCRLALKLITVADLITNGNTIQMSGIPNLTVQWQQRPDKPTQADWTLWRLAVKRLCRPHTWLLEEQLGPSTATNWQKSDNALYCHTGAQWHKYQAVEGRTRGTTERYSYSAVESPPTEAMPAQVTVNGTLVQYNGPLPVDEWPAVASRWPAGARPLFESWQITCREFAAFHGTDWLLVSDGSLKNGHGTAAVVLSAAEQVRVFTLAVPHTQEQLSAYRCELAGIYAGCILVAIAAHLQVTARSVSFYCDCTSAIGQANKVGAVSFKQADFDLVAAIRVLKKKHSIPDIQYVPAHLAVNHLSPMPQRLNHVADTQAKSRWLQEEQEGWKSTWAPVCPLWLVKCNNKVISGSLTQKLQQYTSTRDAHNYWATKDHCLALGTVDTQHLALARAKLPLHRQIWLTKHAVGICGVNKWLKRWEMAESDSCSLCHEAETAQHVWNCRHNDIQELWKTLLLPSPHSAPLGQELWLTWKHGFYKARGMDSTTLVPLEGQFAAAATAQEQIGWEQGLLGYITPQWHTTLLQIQPEKASWWTTKLLSWLIQLGYSFWEARNERVHHNQQSVAHKGLLTQVLDIVRERPVITPVGQPMFNRMAMLTEVEIGALPMSFLQMWTKRIKQERAPTTGIPTQDGSGQVMADWLQRTI